MCKKIKEFFSKSNRYKYLCGGVVVGLVVISVFNAILGTTTMAMVLGYKDKTYSGKWDWIDIACTYIGGVIGSIVRQCINLIILGEVLWM